MSTVIDTTFVQGVQAVPPQGAGWGHLLWILAAALLGFACAALFAGRLHLPRRIFLVPYVAIVSLTFYLFMRWSGISVKALVQHNWVMGVVGAGLVGIFVVRNIFSQPASARLSGPPLLLDLLWSGVVYGLMDALLLSVLPVLATWGAFAPLGWTASWPGKLAVGALAWVASLLVTAGYHLGYPEYRRKRGVTGPAIGNGIMTLGYLLTNNPLTAILSHIAMHIAGVWRGPTSVTQLPPHYPAPVPG